MPSVDVVDETWFAVPARVLAAVFSESQSWPRIWPDLQLEVFADRGAKGMKWTVAGALVGSMEVWLESVDPGGEPGTLLHYFLRADAPGRDGRPEPLPPRRAAAETARRQRAAKRFALTLKRHLECGRPPGEPPEAPPGGPGQGAPPDTQRS
ncbi:MAG TPA: polyketide cyclase / dehydrase and lipid transport [Pseudonocardiaceae bacterium]|jgi:hypothetical protein